MIERPFDLVPIAHLEQQILDLLGEASHRVSRPVTDRALMIVRQAAELSGGVLLRAIPAPDGDGGLHVYWYHRGDGDGNNKRVHLVVPTHGEPYVYQAFTMPSHGRKHRNHWRTCPPTDLAACLKWLDTSSAGPEPDWNTV